MKKDDVEFHGDWRSKQRPAVNVKVYCRTPSTDDVIDRWPECDEKTAEKALEYAYEMAVENFWEQAGESAKEIFGKHVKVFSEGRSGGWLVVDGLDDVKEWDAIALGKWAKLEKELKNDIKWRCQSEQVLGDIEANQWFKPLSERYNFMDSGGETIVIPDLKAQAIQAGFGPIVRK
jgi:hypothetical protein